MPRSADRLPPRTPEERAAHARKAAALYQARDSPRRDSPRPAPGSDRRRTPDRRNGGGGGELDGLYARAMEIAREKEQQLRSAAGEAANAAAGAVAGATGRMKVGATPELLPAAAALPPPTPEAAAAAATPASASRSRAASAAAPAAVATAAAAAASSGEAGEASARTLINTVLLAALPMVRVGCGRLIAKLNDFGGLPMAGPLSNYTLQVCSRLPRRRSAPTVAARQRPDVPPPRPPHTPACSLAQGGGQLRPRQEEGGQEPAAGRDRAAARAAAAARERRRASCAESGGALRRWRPSRAPCGGARA